MALSVNNGDNGGRARRRRGGGAMLAEINVTPFVDVVLVLLIIFMLTAHVMDYGLQIDVPKVRSVSKSVEDLPIVSVDKKGNVYLSDKLVTLDELKPRIDQQFGKVKGVYVRADGQAIWDPVVQVIDALGTAGFSVNIVTQLEDSSRRGKR